MNVKSERLIGKRIFESGMLKCGSSITQYTRQRKHPAAYGLPSSDFLTREIHFIHEPHTR
jgi:hypothetical protein